jgi:hypothetical protein
MGILKQMVACLATCGFKSKCNMRMCSCCVSDCMLEEKPYNGESSESNSVSSVQSKKLKRESNKQLVNRLRTAIV